MGHLVVRFGGFQIGGRLRLIRLLHSGRRGHWLGLSIGWNGEASSLHLVRLLGIALVPHRGNFRLLAPVSVCLGDLRLASTLLLDVGLDDLRSGASGVVSVLAFFQQHSNHDLGIAPRRDADEPAIVLEVLPFGAEPLLQIVGDGLRAARLAREVNALQALRWARCPPARPPAPGRR